MPKFTIKCRRTEIYTAEASVEADSREEAVKQVESAFLFHGWDGVFDGDDGEYEECYSHVVRDEEPRESTPHLPGAAYGLAYEDVMGGVSVDLYLDEDDPQEVLANRDEAELVVVVSAGDSPPSVFDAAPDMLDALERVFDLIECNCGCNGVCTETCTYSYVDRAIKKARGE